jgi:hypothetical protein
LTQNLLSCKHTNIADREGFGVDSSANRRLFASVFVEEADCTLALAVMLDGKVY